MLAAGTMRVLREKWEIEYPGDGALTAVQRREKKVQYKRRVLERVGKIGGDGDREYK